MRKYLLYPLGKSCPISNRWPSSTFDYLWIAIMTVEMNGHLEHQLERRKIKPTAMRLLVLDFFQQNDRAISLKDLENGLESTDRVTLFRTLKTFEEHKIIHSIDDGSGAMKYAMCGDNCECDYARDAHVHFHCKICNETQCLPKVKVPPLALPANFLPEEANVVVKGICAKCHA